MNKRYHKNVYWESDFDPWVQNTILAYGLKGQDLTTHYIQRLRSRHISKVPTVDELLRGKVMELEVADDGKLQKAVIRMSHNKSRDMITAVGFSEEFGLIYITSFTTPRSHRNWKPDVSKYERGENNESA